MFYFSQVVEKPLHTLHGRTIDPKRAKARGRPEPIKKVFVGGLDHTISEDDLREHFTKYGKVKTHGSKNLEI